MSQQFRYSFFLAAILLLSATAHAQFRYTFKDTTTPYAPLSGASSLNGSTVWDDEDFSTTMPFSWKLDSNLTETSFNLSLGIFGVFHSVTSYMDMNGFYFGDMDAADRGTLTGTSSLSPIRYLTIGTAPNRIFKLEFANAGFYDEYDLYQTMNDSFSMQVWIYETSNIVEYHYGPSHITYASDYFGINGTGPSIGYMKHADFVGGTGDLYFLTGNASSPTLDSAMLPSFPATALNSWPASGEVYRFTPKWQTCTPPIAGFTAGTPSGKTVQHTYNGTTSGIDSLVWNWGDGIKQKVTSGFTTPITHTYTSDGRYTVTVTAYNSCGNNTSTKQVALTVGDLAALGNIKVYPNPATEVLFVEGLERGGNALVRSAIGQVVLRSELSVGKGALNIAALPAGIYSLTITNASGISGVVRFTKQ